MKPIILSALIFLLSLSAGAQPSSWEDQIASAFYSRISTPGYFDCCTKTGKKKRLTVYVDLPENAFFRDDFLIKTYSEQAFDSTTVIEVAQKAAAQYVKRFCKKKRDRFTRSCYSTQIGLSVIEDLNEGVVFVRGRLRLDFTFQ